MHNNKIKNDNSFMKKQLENIKQINAVLQLLSKDDDLHDDFKMPEVLQAINHWTGKNRLSIEEALKLQDHRRVVYVLKRFQMLQHVCNAAGIAVPLDYLVQRKVELSTEFIQQYFHIDIDSYNTTSNSVSDNTSISVVSASTSIAKSSNSVKQATTITHIKTTSHNDNEFIVESSDKDTNNNDCDTISSDKPIKTHISNINTTMNITSYNHINQILKISIAIVFILIAITLSYLPKSFWIFKYFHSSNK